jgi:hypothetical protein
LFGRFTLAALLDKKSSASSAAFFRGQARNTAINSKAAQVAVHPETEAGTSDGIDEVVEFRLRISARAALESSKACGVARNGNRGAFEVRSERY